MVVTDGSAHEYSELEQVNLTQMGLMKSMGQEIISRARLHVQDAGGKVNALEVMIGSPPHGIVAFAEGVGADCIVMGRRGLGEIRGLFMGSVSHRVGQLTDRTLITTE
jgi:nucleotide-binding universal stress UspA family protein